jgi:hypothetical protein
VLALEHVDPALPQRRDELVAAADVPVVVAEHREHGHVEAARRGGHHRPLPRLAVRREVARQQHQVDAVAQAGERLGPALAIDVAPDVDVARGRDPDHALVGLLAPGGALRADGHGAARTRVRGRTCHPTSSPSPRSRRR